MEEIPQDSFFGDESSVGSEDDESAPPPVASVHVRGLISGGTSTRIGLSRFSDEGEAIVAAHL